MPIHMQDTAVLLTLLIALCFSFCISVIAMWFRKSADFPKMLGLSFIPVFLFNLASLLITGYLPAVLSHISEPLFMLLFVLLLAGERNKRGTLHFKYILFLLPAGILAIALLSASARIFLSDPLTSISVMIVSSVMLLYLLKNEKGDLNILFWAVLPMLAASIAQYYPASGLLSFIEPVLKLGAYIAFLKYFYRALYTAQLKNVGEAEKKLAAINRSIDYEVKKRMLEIEKVNQNLVRIAKTDAMSKVLNKVALLEAMEKLIHRKTKTEFSILIIDIDNFKAVNDTLGHVTGDKCIKLLAAIARNNIRDIDLIGRYGGDEFIIVLPGTPAEQAFLIAERFRKRIEASDSPHFTVSIGISTYPADGTDVKSLLEAADEGLYRSKNKGRNAVSLAP